MWCGAAVWAQIVDRLTYAVAIIVEFDTVAGSELREDNTCGARQRRFRWVNWRRDSTKDTIRGECVNRVTDSLDMNVFHNLLQTAGRDNTIL